jgi:hypothetical protein
VAVSHPSVNKVVWPNNVVPVNNRATQNSKSFLIFDLEFGFFLLKISGSIFISISRKNIQLMLISETII